MRVAVVTPYLDEPSDVLGRCHRSVVAQSWPETAHILVADGNPQAVVADWAAEHIVLPRTYADCGNTPRTVGATIALGQGFDAICFLDADCWFETTHIERLIRLVHTAEAAVVTANRMLRRPDGSPLGVCTESDGRTFSDTNCLLLTRAAAEVLPHWVLHNARNAQIADRMVWAAICRAGFRRAHSVEPTVNYTTLWAAHYLARGERPPCGSKHVFEVGGIARALRLDQTDLDLNRWCEAMGWPVPSVPAAMRSLPPRS